MTVSFSNKWNKEITVLQGPGVDGYACYDYVSLSINYSVSCICNFLDCQFHSRQIWLMESCLSTDANRGCLLPGTGIKAAIFNQIMGDKVEDQLEHHLF